MVFPTILVLGCCVRGFLPQVPLGVVPWSWLCSCFFLFLQWINYVCFPAPQKKQEKKENPVVKRGTLHKTHFRVTNTLKAPLISNSCAEKKCTTC